MNRCSGSGVSFEGTTKGSTLRGYPIWGLISKKQSLWTSMPIAEYPHLILTKQWLRLCFWPSKYLPETRISMIRELRKWGQRSETQSRLPERALISSLPIGDLLDERPRERHCETVLYRCYDSQFQPSVGCCSTTSRLFQDVSICFSHIKDLEHEVIFFSLPPVLVLQPGQFPPPTQSPWNECVQYNHPSQPTVTRYSPSFRASLRFIHLCRFLNVDIRSWSDASRIHVVSIERFHLYPLAAIILLTSYNKL